MISRKPRRNTNLEAADEIARQLRLRDLGGLVVIDFIDMMASRNQREVENRLRDAVKLDRARVQIGRISRFGLLEMSRQRLRPSLGESTQVVCPRCSGHGTVRTVESLSLSLVRIIEEEALKENTGRVDVQVPVDVATYLLNEKRAAIAEVEKQTGVNVMVIANLSLETPQYKVERVRQAELADEDKVSSYRHAEIVEQNYDPEQYREALIQPEQAAVQRVIPSKPLPKAPEQAAAPVQKKAGLLTGLISLFVGGDAEKKAERKAEKKTEAAETTEKPKARPSTRTSGGQRGSRGGRSRGGRSRNRPRSDQNQKTPQAQKQQGQQDKQPAAESTTQQKAQPASTTAEKSSAPEALDKSTEKQPAKTRGRRSRRGGGRRRRDPNAADKPQTAESQNAAAKPEQSAETGSGERATQVKTNAPRSKPAAESATSSAPANDAPAPAAKQSSAPAQDAPAPAAKPSSAPAQDAPAPAAKQSSAPASASSTPAPAAAPAPVAASPAAARPATDSGSTTPQNKPADKVTSND